MLVEQGDPTRLMAHTLALPRNDPVRPECSSRGLQEKALGVGSSLRGMKEPLELGDID